MVNRSTITERQTLLLLLFFSACFLLCLPFYRSIWWMGDEGIWLNGAQRLLKGKVIYQDFFEFHPPGSFIIVAGWLKAFGESFLSVRGLAAVTLAIVATLTLRACVVASGHGVLSLALVLTWLFYSLAIWPLQLNHHWFTTLFTVAGFLTLLADDEPNSAARTNWFLAGLLYGGAAMITPTRGAYAILAALPLLLYADRRIRSLMLLSLGCAVIPVATVVWIAAHGSLTNAFDDIILYPLSSYSSIQKVAFGAGGGVLNPIRLSYPLAFTLCVVNFLLQRRALLTRNFVACLGLAVAGLLGCFPRPDLVHITFTLPLVLPLVALNLATISSRLSNVIPLGIILASCVLCLLGARAYYHRVAMTWRDMSVVESPRGLLSFSGDVYAPSVIEELARVPSGARVAFYPYIPMLPFLMNREDALRFDVFVPEYTTLEQYGETCRDVASKTDYVVWEQDWSDPDFLKKIFPAMANPDTNGKLTLEAAFQTGFDIIFKNDKYQIRKRNDRPADLLCRDISVGR
jgi:hypothetical protein